MSGSYSRDPTGPPGSLAAVAVWLKTRSRKLVRLFGPQEKEAMAPATGLANRLRVLVADDSPVNLLVISAQMELMGLVPLLAADGAEALALASELPFDIVLMDLNMPVLDGLQATAAIRRFESLHRLAPVPVIAYSNAAPGSDALAAHGFNGSLNKPCQDDELLECLELWCPSFSAPSTQGLFAAGSAQVRPAAVRRVQTAGPAGR